MLIDKERLKDIIPVIAGQQKFRAAIVESGFDFFQEKFIRLFKRKLADEGYEGDYKQNFGLNAYKI